MSAVVSHDAEAIETLLRDPRVWRGAALEREVPAVPSGHAALDALLPHHGWTIGTLSEVLLDLDGVGELELLLPAIATLTGQRKHVVIVAAPYVLYPLALLACGVNLDYLHCVVTTSDIEALWASEQCLRSGVCAAVLCWPHQANDRALRRLQVAAESGHALGFAFRAARVAANPSPAATRVQLQVSDETRLRILKCRGANAPAQMVRLRFSLPVAKSDTSSRSPFDNSCEQTLIDAAHRFMPARSTNSIRREMAAPINAELFA
jgi:hypothetical protein